MFRITVEQVDSDGVVTQKNMWTVPDGAPYDVVETRPMLPKYAFGMDSPTSMRVGPTTLTIKAVTAPATHRLLPIPITGTAAAPAFSESAWQTIVRRACLMHGWSACHDKDGTVRSVIRRNEHSICRLSLVKTTRRIYYCDQPLPDPLATAEWMHSLEQALAKMTDDEPAQVPAGACCANEQRNISGGCDSCGSPCL